MLFTRKKHYYYSSSRQQLMTNGCNAVTGRHLELIGDCWPGTVRTVGHTWLMSASSRAARLSDVLFGR